MSLPCSQDANFLFFMLPEVSLLCLQNVTLPDLTRSEFRSQKLLPYFFNIHFNIIVQCSSKFWRWYILYSYEFCIVSMRTICPVNLVSLYLIILITIVFPLPEVLFDFAAIILSSFTKYSNRCYVVFHPYHVNAYVFLYRLPATV
jgi:hypothetical protein